MRHVVLLTVDAYRATLHQRARMGRGHRAIGPRAVFSAAKGGHNNPARRSAHPHQCAAAAAGFEVLSCLQLEDALKVWGRWQRRRKSTNWQCPLMSRFLGTWFCGLGTYSVELLEQVRAVLKHIRRGRDAEFRPARTRQFVQLTPNRSMRILVPAHCDHGRNTEHPARATSPHR